MKINPRIALTMRLELSSRRFYLGRYYSEALRHFGAIPVHISLFPDPGYVSGVLDGVDGILLPGSDTDVALIYMGKNHMPVSNVAFPKRTRRI